jgi:hypothetical protein
MTTSRRTVLAGGGLLSATGLAGCVLPFGRRCVRTASFDVSEADDDEVAGEFSSPPSDLGLLDRELGRTAVEGDFPEAAGERRVVRDDGEWSVASDTVAVQ